VGAGAQATKIQGSMAKPSFRTRPDGIIQIERPSRPRDVLVGVGTALAAFGLVFAIAAAFALYVLIGLPVLVAGIAFLLVRHVRRSRREPASAAAQPPADLVTLRPAPAAAAAAMREGRVVPFRVRSTP
jgi:hypothetical protein